MIQLIQSVQLIQLIQFNSRTAGGKRCIGQGIKKGWGISMTFPGMPSSQYLHVFTNSKISNCFV